MNAVQKFGLIVLGWTVVILWIERKGVDRWFR